MAKLLVKTCERKVEFYWLYTSDNKTKSNFISVVNDIEKLQYDLSSQKNRFYKIGNDGQYVSMRFNTLSDKEKCSGAICYTRTSELPSVDIKGTEKILILDKDADGLLEKGHFLVIPWENNEKNGLLLILEKNLHAPNIVIFYKYLTKKFTMNNLQIHRLTKKDIFTELSSAKGFLGLDFKYSKSLYAIEASQDYKNPWKLFDAMKEMKSQTFSIVLSAGRKKDELLNNSIMQDIINMCKDIKYRNSIRTAKVRYLDSNNKSQLIDIMAGDIVESVSVPYNSNNSKNIDSNAMHNELIKLYNKMIDKLKKANTISVLYEKDGEQNDKDSEEDN